MSFAKIRRSVDNIELNFRRQNQIILPEKNKFSRKSFQTKKLKTLLSLYDAQVTENKNKRKSSIFHLIGEEDKFKQIEKNIQNRILKMSMTIIGNSKMDELKRQKTKKRQKSKVDIHPFAPGSNQNGTPKNKLKHSFIKKRSHKLESIKKFVYERNRKLKKIRKLRDSSGEDESEKEKEQGDYGINPRSSFINVFDFLLLLSSGFCLFYLPYRLATGNMIIKNNEYLILFLIDLSEILYVLDLIFGFFRWFYNNEFKMVTNMYMIISNYFSSDFTLDLIMAIPYYTILRFQKIVKYDYKTIYNESHTLLKILVCFKAFKIFKLIKVKNNRVVYFINRKLSKNYVVEGIYQMVNFMIITLSMFNFIICLHIYMAQQSYPNWIVSNNLADKHFIDIYLASFYFIIATMTSVGYGDITCISIEETFFQIILLSIGLVAYSWIISTVGDYVKNQSRASMNYNRDMTKLEEIRIAYPNMSFKLYKKIQQHIRRMLTQSKKYEYNILINSLPYYLQNSVLLQIHKNEINNFRFFRNIDNSDFILKVLTHFIPIFSKQNIVLVGEGELFENIFFIKNGRLSLEAIIDLDEVEISIEKYLKYRFEEIDQLEELYDKEKSLEKSRILNRSFRKSQIKNPYKLLEIINKQFENVEDLPYIHESTIDQEIGQVDFHIEIQDLYKGNIKYIPILDLLKNEYFGDLLMFSNIENPLSLRVKSKRVELYVLRKKDALSIKKDYPNIWQRLHKKSMHNITSLKSLTLKIINRYCEMNGIIINGKDVVRTGKKFSVNQPASKSMSITKFQMFKNRNSSLKYTFNSYNFQDFNTKKKSVKFNERNSIKLPRKTRSIVIYENMKQKKTKKRTKKKGKSFSPIKKRGTIIDSSELSSSLSFSLSERTINIKLNKHSPETESKNHNHNYNFNKHKKNNHINMNNISVKRDPFFGGYMPFYESKSANLFYGKSLNSDKAQKITNSNNLFVITKTSSIHEANAENSKNSLKNITSESTISFEIKSSYKNINEVAKGKYLKDHKFQKFIQKIAKYYIKTKSKRKEKKYLKSILKKTNLNSNPSISLPKNGEDSKDSIESGKNKNSMDNNVVTRNSKSSIDKNKVIPIDDIKNKLINQKSKEFIFSLSKGKYALESKGGKSVNSIKQLNLIDINKNQELLSESNDFNVSIEPLNENNLKYKYIPNFKKIEQADNNQKLNEMVKLEKSGEKIYSNKIIKKKDGNSIHEVNLNYVNNFCCIW